MKCAWHTCNNKTSMGVRGLKKFCNKKCKNKYYVDRRRKKLKTISVDYKGGSCQICNYSKCVWALEFHHLDSSKKDFSLSSNGNTKSWDCIRMELDKCILVCSNCHREIHAGITLTVGFEPT